VLLSALAPLSVELLSRLQAPSWRSGVSTIRVQVFQERLRELGTVKNGVKGLDARDLDVVVLDQGLDLIKVPDKLSLIGLVGQKDLRILAPNARDGEKFVPQLALGLVGTIHDLVINLGTFRLR